MLIDNAKISAKIIGVLALGNASESQASPSGILKNEVSKFLSGARAA